MSFMKDKDISPFKNLLVPLAQVCVHCVIYNRRSYKFFFQMPIFISFFVGLRRMANAPVDSFHTGGMMWFTDLTVCDPYYILPVITSVTLWATVEVS
jgi:YidC/Oxa1 family membrane protein insertase